jgi:glycosyltransferase involved in cell wall biosynthesis
VAFKSAKWPKIAIIGCYPPPYGGISIHLERLVRFLSSKKADFKLFNTLSDSQKPEHIISVAKFKYRWYLKFLLFHKCRIVHLCSPNRFGRILFAIMARLKPKNHYIYSIHGRHISDALKPKSSIKARINRWSLRQMDMVIACNDHIAKQLTNDVGLPSKSVSHIPAFIAPEPDTSIEIPRHIESFLKKHDPVLFSVGWIGQRYKGADLYGVDMLIDLIDRLKDDYKDIGMLFSVNGGKSEDVSKTMSICRERIRSRMLLITEDLPDISGIMAACDVFLRPTNTDGDSVSVREALHLNIPTVASDAVVRPYACQEFVTRSMDDFEQKVRKVLENKDKFRSIARQFSMPDNAEPIYSVYRSFLKGKSE